MLSEGRQGCLLLVVRFAACGRFVPALLALEARDLPSLLVTPNLPNLVVGPRPTFSTVAHVQPSTSSAAEGSYVTHDAQANDTAHAIVDPNGRPAAELIGELQMTVNHIRQAKSRVLRRLREEVGELFD
jgi:hypothetical protein